MNNKKSNTNIRNVNRNINLRILAVLGLLVSVIVAGCIDGEKKNGDIGTPIPQKTPDITTPKEAPDQGTTGTPTPQGTPGSTVSSGTQGIMDKYSLEKLISISDSIVIGTVLNISSKWNTLDGKKSTTDSNNFIYTDVDIKSEEYLKNPLDTEIIIVRVLGGTTSDVEDQPSFKIGEKILIFLKEDSDPRTKDIGSKHLVVAGLIQGKIDIPEDKYVTIGDEKMALESVRTKIKG